MTQMKYYYELKSTGPRVLAPFIDADTDEGAIRTLQEKFGEHLPDVSFVYAEESYGNIRTIWME